MAESVDKNMIDKDEYPQTAEIERRCAAILADLFLTDLRAVTGGLDAGHEPSGGRSRREFHH